MDGLQALIANGERAQSAVNSMLTKGERLMDRVLMQRVELSPHEAYGAHLEKSRDQAFARMHAEMDNHLSGTPCANCEHCVEKFDMEQRPHMMTVGIRMVRECTQTHTPERVCPDGFFPMESMWAQQSLPTEFEIHNNYGINGEKNVSLTIIRKEVESRALHHMDMITGMPSAIAVRATVLDLPKSYTPQGDYGRQINPDYLDENEVSMLSAQVAAFITEEERRKREKAAPQTPTEDAW